MANARSSAETRDRSGPTDERSRDEQTNIQESEYAFPYHYIANVGCDGFTQCFNDSWGINYIATIELVLDILREEKFESLVDIGCGDGRLTREIQQAFPRARVVGVDSSRRAIELARVMSPGITFLCTDITASPRLETFELGVLMEVFEHVPPALCSEFVRAIGELLQPGSTLIVTVPHSNKPVEPKHYRHFDTETLIGEFGPLFKADRIIPIEQRSFLFTLIKRALTNRLFVLNNRRIGGWLYRFYKRNLFLASDESRCNRLVVLFKRQ